MLPRLGVTTTCPASASAPTAVSVMLASISRERRGRLDELPAGVEDVALVRQFAEDVEDACLGTLRRTGRDAELDADPVRGLEADPEDAGGEWLDRDESLELMYHHAVAFQRAFSIAPWEPQIGYCRAVRAGSHIYVTGTAPVAEGGGVHAPGDATRQARRASRLSVVPSRRWARISRMWSGPGCS